MTADIKRVHCIQCILNYYPMSTTMASKPFTLRIDEELEEALEIVSRISKRSKASVANEAMRESIITRAKHMKMIAEAKEEAKKGEFISQEAMEAWVDSLGTDNELPPPEPDVFK